MNKKIDNGKKFMKLGLVFGVALLFVVAFSMSGIKPDNIEIGLHNLLDNDEPETTWQTVAVVSNGWVLAEYPQTEDTSGWLSSFWLDYGEVPGTVLQNNLTDWNTSGTTRGYCEEDDATLDLASNDPAYFVVRCKFNRTHCYDDSLNCFIGSRTRVNLTLTGDETVSYTVYCNNTAETYGGGIESDNNSANGSIYINFYWDDNTDGYRITDDGTINWSIHIEAKY